MIDHLRGDLIRKDGGAIVVRTGGIGFRLEVPGGAYAEVPLGEPVEVPTTLVFRQDGFALFGFSNATEREFFGLLTTITGIGPKSALGILSHSTPAQLADAIIREDISALVQVKGIGKKGGQTHHRRVGRENSRPQAGFGWRRHGFRTWASSARPCVLRPWRFCSPLAAAGRRPKTLSRLSPTESSSKKKTPRTSW
jgi:hypothetical protein